MRNSLSLPCFALLIHEAHTMYSCAESTFGTATLRPVVNAMMKSAFSDTLSWIPRAQPRKSKSVSLQVLCIALPIATTNELLVMNIGRFIVLPIINHIIIIQSLHCVLQQLLKSLEPIACCRTLDSYNGYRLTVFATTRVVYHHCSVAPSVTAHDNPELVEMARVDEECGAHEFFGIVCSMFSTVTFET